MYFGTATRADLPTEIPELLSASAYFDAELGEYQESYECDLGAMRQSRGFLNGVSLNLDAYDAYLRDGLIPWNDQFSKVHDMVDAKLGLRHEGEDG